MTGLHPPTYGAPNGNDRSLVYHQYVTKSSRKIYMHALSHFYFSKNCITFALERLNSHMRDRLTDRRATATWWSRENNRSGVCVCMCV